MHRRSTTLSIVVVAALAVAILLPGLLMAKGDPGYIEPGNYSYFPADAFEPDNTKATASVGLPEVTFHTSHPEDYRDLTKVSSTTSGTPFIVEVMMEDGSGSWDTSVVVYDSDWNEVAYDDDHDYFSTYSSGTFWVAGVGDYYISSGPLFGRVQGSYHLYQRKGIGRRIWGSDRYETAVAVSKQMYSDTHIESYGTHGVEGIVVASGYDFADAMTGAVLASAVDGPLLLTPPTWLPTSVRDEIERVLRSDWHEGDVPTRVYVVGGPGAVSTAVMASIAAITDVDEVIRVSGGDRYETAGAIAEKADDVASLETTAYVVNGTAWADALAAGAPACYASSPILLTKKDSLPQGTVDALGDLSIGNVVIIGGTGVVSNAVQTQIESIIGTGTVRIAGANRYQTARLVAEHAVDDIGLYGDRMILASGEGWPDGLTAGPLVYNYDNGDGVEGPILLTQSHRLSPEVKAFMDDYGPMWDISYLVGGAGAVPDAVYNAWANYYDPADYVGWTDDGGRRGPPRR